MRQTVSITLQGVPLSIECSVTGKDIAATHDSPAEERGITIHKITATDSWVELQPILEVHEEEIFNLTRKQI